MFDGYREVTGARKINLCGRWVVYYLLAAADITDYFAGLPCRHTSHGGCNNTTLSYPAPGKTPVNMVDLEVQ